MESHEDAGRKAKAILVVEDEPLLRAVAADFLIDSGFDVIEASSADDALGILERGCHISLLFSDIQLPGALDGVELAILVSARWPQVALILTSGNSQPSSYALPAKTIFLAKPYDLPAVAKIAAAA
jgi:two-component system, response regulator PdtaR